MHAIDWVIVASLALVLASIAIYTNRYMKGIADFLAANRLAGRYMLTLADGMAGLGAIGIIATFQQFYQGGFGAAWWGQIMAPILLLLPLTGFIIYRFRSSRVMTIAEFYEKRYSRKFRIFAGMLAFFAGVINYGVFPQVTARFLIYFCDIPQYGFQIGTFTVDLTLGLLMAILLGVALTLTLRGGQIAIMITDFLQAQFLNIIFILILFVLLWHFSLSDIVATLKTAPEGQSMLNPFDQADVPDFNMFFFFIMAFNAIYTYMAWQGNQGYNCAAKNPHEAKMARILAAWRFGATWTVIMLIAIFAWVLMNGNLAPEMTAAAEGTLSGLGNEGLERQLTVPIALQQLLPVGVFGLFVVAIVAAAISTDDTYLHSWGSIFIQDVYLPIKGGELTPQKHLALLRRSIFGVAVFVWCFGMIFPLYEYIFMYWAITGAIYVGGAGAVIIGGFYWKRATTAGAWAGMITGSILAFTGVIANNILWPHVLPHLKDTYSHIDWLMAIPDQPILDGARLFFIASLVAIFTYVTVSLLTKPRPDFNMDKLLNRGEFALPEEQVVGTVKPGLAARLIGVSTEYNRFDKFIAYAILAWTVFWFSIFIVGTLAGIFLDLSDDHWATYWIISQGIMVAVGIITVIWFLVGGFRDLANMLRDLHRVKRDIHDDGIVREEEGGDRERNPVKVPDMGGD